MLCDFVPPEHSHFAPETLSFLAEAVSCFARNPVFMPETLSLCRKPCPIIQEPMFSQAKITVLLCQNHCPIMPKSLSYNARTPVLLCQNPCPYQARIPVQQARTPVLLGQKPCPFIPKPQKFLKKTIYFSKKPCSILPKTVSKSPIISPLHKISLFVLGTLFFVPKPFFYHPSLYGTSPPFQNLVGIFPYLLLGANQPALEGGVNARKNLRPFSCSFTLLRATWEEGK